MAENANTRKPVEVGLNKYGQRLDEFSEFGQSLEAEVWYFDAVFNAAIDQVRTAFPVQAAQEINTAAKPVEAGLNKYGQRLDEYNEFGQSLEAEAWYFEALVGAPVAPAPVLEIMSLPVQDRKQAAAVADTSQTTVHLQAA